MGIVVLGIMIGFGILLAQGAVWGFGFEKNSGHRKGADAESVAGCMESCEDMLAGWLEMNPESPNYTRQQEKIAAKAEQCLAMNELAGFHYSEEEILASCGLIVPHCVEVSEEEVQHGACIDIPFTGELLDLPQCCPIEAPRDCGAKAEWVVGVTAVPDCYIPGS